MTPSGLARWLLVAATVAMPVIATLSQQRVFGPDNATLSDRYPTLIIAAGYAFSIWGPIFLLAVVFGIWQAWRDGGEDPVEVALRRVRWPLIAGYGLTAVWMIAFPLQVFWLALLIIWGGLACFAVAAVRLSDALGRGAAMRPDRGLGGLRAFAWLPVSLQAGWMALAAFLNLAQTIVAYRVLPTDRMLGWSLALLALATVLLLLLNRRMRGNLPFVAAAVWGLVAVWVKQTGSALPGAGVSGWVALVIAVLLIVQTVSERRRHRREIGGA